MYIYTSPPLERGAKPRVHNKNRFYICVHVYIHLYTDNKVSVLQESEKRQFILYINICTYINDI